MLKQKRKAQSPPRCLSCRRQRTEFNCESRCNRCVEKDFPEQCSYSRNTNLHSVGSSHKIRDTSSWASKSAMPCATDLSGISVTVEKNEWLRIQDELQYLRAQHRKFMAIKGLIRAQNWVALDMFASFQPEDNGRHEPQTTTEKMESFTTSNGSNAGQEVAYPAQYDYQNSSLAKPQTTSSNDHAFQNKSQPFATNPIPPAQSIAGLSNDMMTPRNSYAWHQSPFNATSPTPSLTLTRSSSVSVPYHKTLWPNVTRTDETEPRQPQPSQWSFEAAPQDRGKILEGRVVTDTDSKTVIGDMDLQWRDSNLSNMPVPSNLPLFFDPESDAEIDLALASEFAIHPPMVRPEWRSPQIRQATLSKREPVTLPNLSSHVPCGSTYPAQWNNELISPVYSATEISNDCPSYPVHTAMNLPSTSYSQPPCTVTTPVKTPTFKELPIRFTQSMYNSLKDFSQPPSVEKDSPFINDASHYAHGSFRPRQYNPNKDYVIQTRDFGL